MVTSQELEEKIREWCDSCPECGDCMYSGEVAALTRCEKVRNGVVR